MLLEYPHKVLPSLDAALDVHEQVLGGKRLLKAAEQCQSEPCAVPPPVAEEDLARHVSRAAARYRAWTLAQNATAVRRAPAARSPGVRGLLSQSRGDVDDVGIALQHRDPERFDPFECACVRSGSSLEPRPGASALGAGTVFERLTARRKAASPQSPIATNREAGSPANKASRR